MRIDQISIPGKGTGHGKDLLIPDPFLQLPLMVAAYPIGAVIFHPDDPVQHQLAVFPPIE